MESTSLFELHYGMENNQAIVVWMVEKAKMVALGRPPSPPSPEKKEKGEQMERWTHGTYSSSSVK